VPQLPGLGRVRVDGDDRAADRGERAAVEVADLGALDRQDRVRALGQHLRARPARSARAAPDPRFRVGIGCTPLGQHLRARPARSARAAPDPGSGLDWVRALGQHLRARPARSARAALAPHAQPARLAARCRRAGPGQAARALQAARPAAPVQPPKHTAS